jgi:hypothetical protein
MISNDFKMNLKDWILLDNKISETNKTLNELRKKKNNSEEAILEYIKSNKMDNNRFNVGPFSIIVNTSYNLAPLNLECIEGVLLEAFKDNREPVDKIMNSIKRKRDNNRKPIISLRKKSNKSRSNKLKKK